MQKSQMIDFTKLLGFETIAELVAEDFDLRDETLGAKLGAKVGEFEPIGPLTGILE